MGHFDIVTVDEGDRIRRRRLVALLLTLVLVGLLCFWAFSALSSRNKSRSAELAKAGESPMTKTTRSSPSQLPTTIPPSAPPQIPKASNSDSKLDSRSYVIEFHACGRAPRVNCVIDGDTFYLEGDKIRIASIDTPEISSPQCNEELNRGVLARSALIMWLNDGEFEVTIAPEKEDMFRRTLAYISRNGEDVGQSLIAQGLAHPWNGTKLPWCN